MKEYKHHYWGRCRGLQTTNPDSVTCRVCLYHLGLYMPLVKLKAHQHRERWQWVGQALANGLFVSPVKRVTLEAMRARYGQA